LAAGKRFAVFGRRDKNNNISGGIVGKEVIRLHGKEVSTGCRKDGVGRWGGGGNRIHDETGPQRRKGRCRAKGNEKFFKIRGLWLGGKGAPLGLETSCSIRTQSKGSGEADNKELGSRLTVTRNKEGTGQAVRTNGKRAGGTRSRGTNPG